MKDFDYEQYKKLKAELDKDIITKAELQILHKFCAKHFPIGVTVKVLYTGYTGIVDSYNDRTSGFYPANRYPVYIKITHSEDPNFTEKAVGRIFEYGFEQLQKVINQPN